VHINGAYLVSCHLDYGTAVAMQGESAILRGGGMKTCRRHPMNRGVTVPTIDKICIVTIDTTRKQREEEIKIQK
jgi:hypothetical protein